MENINSYVFRHQSAVLAESIKTRDHEVDTQIKVLIALTVVIILFVCQIRISQDFNIWIIRWRQRGRSVGALNVCSLFWWTLPEGGTALPKHVWVNTYHELYFMTWILLYFIERICWLIYWILNVDVVLKIKHKLYRASGSAPIPQSKILGTRLPSDTKSRPRKTEFPKDS